MQDLGHVFTIYSICNFCSNPFIMFNTVIFFKKAFFEKHTGHTLMWSRFVFWYWITAVLGWKNFTCSSSSCHEFCYIFCCENGEIVAACSSIRELDIIWQFSFRTYTMWILAFNCVQVCFFFFSMFSFRRAKGQSEAH